MPSYPVAQEMAPSPDFVVAVGFSATYPCAASSAWLSAEHTWGVHASAALEKKAVTSVELSSQLLPATNFELLEVVHAIAAFGAALAMGVQAPHSTSPLTLRYSPSALHWIVRPTLPDLRAWESRHDSNPTAAESVGLIGMLTLVKSNPSKNAGRLSIQVISSQPLRKKGPS